MTIEIVGMDEVKDVDLQREVEDFARDGANIVTAINDGKGTFSIDATYIDVGPQQSITQSGRMSTFGGPHDTGVGVSEGVALYDAADLAAAPAGLFLDSPPPGTTGLARRLNPAANYLAYRWDYTVTPRDFLRQNMVTVSAKGKSIAARPVDWGPNISTGRIVDLSPGLASALSLNTNDTCTVVIPVPDGAAIPIPAAAPAVGVNLIVIDAMTFPSDMTRTLLVMTTSNNTTYWVVNLVGQNEGGQTLMRRVGNNNPEVILSDSVILPIEANGKVPAAVAGELNKAVAPESGGAANPAAGPAPAAGDDINAKMFAQAKAFVGHVTSSVPGTDHGNLACAWAVNEVTRLALGKPISSDGQGGDGLSTDGIFDALTAHHIPLGSAADAKPGTIIIAPTQGTNHGHVGIVGATTSSVANTQVFSNKSVPGVFERNYTIGTFTARYQSKGLQVLFFALKADQFTA